jgi:hypothetical protein
MASANTSNQAALLKTLYGKGVTQALYERSIVIADAKKTTDFGGKEKQINIRINGTAGASADFATALNNLQATTEKTFTVTRRREFSLFSIQGEAIRAARGDKNAVQDILKGQTDGAKYAFEKAISARVWGDAGGSIGVIGAGANVATPTIPLARKSDVINFEPGMYVQTASDNGTATNPAGVNGGAAAQLQIISRDVNAGTLTANANWNTLTGTVAGHRIFRSGDYTKAMTGLAGWLPDAAPSPAENFFGMDRSVGDPARQSGLRVSGAGKTKEDTLIDAGVQAKRMGSRLKRCYTSPEDFGDLQKELGSKVVVQMSTREGDLGFTGIKVHTPAGTVDVIADEYCPVGVAKMINPDDLEMSTLGDCPGVLDEDGVGALMRAHNDDAYIGRLGAYGNFIYRFNNVPVHISWV